jgi:hypothetical protein
MLSNHRSRKHPRLRVHNTSEHVPVAPYWTPVEATRPETVSTLSEINLYIDGYNRMWRWLLYISKSRAPQKIYNLDEFVALRTHCIDKLPSGMGLKNILDTDDPVNKWAFRTAYAVCDSRNLCSVNRPAVLVNVSNLLRSMRALRPSLASTLTTEQCAQVEVLYRATETAFDAWTAVARVHVIQGIRSLREREETWRRRILARRPNLTRE